MGFLRQRGKNYSFTFKWKGKPYIKALGTTDQPEAVRIKKDADAQLLRIRTGKSPTASKLLAEGFNIVVVLFGSPEIAARLAVTADENPLTIAELAEGYLAHLKTTVNFDQQANSESWMKKVRSHLGDDRRVMSLTADDLQSYAHDRADGDGVGNTSILKELGSLRAAIRWAVTNKRLPSDPITKWPSLKTKRQKQFEWKSDIEDMIKSHDFKDDAEKQAFLDEMKMRMVLTAEDNKKLVDLAREKLPALVLPLMVVCSTGIRRKELATLPKRDFDSRRGTILVGSRKQSKSVDVTHRRINLPVAVAEALREHVAKLAPTEMYLFPVFGEIDTTYGHRWVEHVTDGKGQPKLNADGHKIVKTDRHGKPILAKRKLPEDRLRAEKAGRMLDNLI